VIEYGFPGSQMLEYGFPGGLKAAWGNTNPKITNDHFFPLRATAQECRNRTLAGRTKGSFEVF